VVQAALSLAGCGNTYGYWRLTVGNVAWRACCQECAWTTQRRHTQDIAECAVTIRLSVQPTHTPCALMVCTLHAQCGLTSRFHQARIDPPIWLSVTRVEGPHLSKYLVGKVQHARSPAVATIKAVIIYTTAEQQGKHRIRSYLLLQRLPMGSTQPSMSSIAVTFISCCCQLCCTTNFCCCAQASSNHAITLSIPKSNTLQGLSHMQEVTVVTMR